MDAYKKNKILKKLSDSGYIEKKELKSSENTVIEEIKEEMEKEIEKNSKLISDLQVELLLLDFNIIPQNG
ncbi:hypothetical protein [Leptobacterium sp. I13]|uniref:hypothetical protein n=1 Tax=Leptobacterium meishanense TaxID=3128904 RepID=UPI0030EDEA38